MLQTSKKANLSYSYENMLKDNRNIKINDRVLKSQLKLDPYGFSKLASIYGKYFLSAYKKARLSERASFFYMQALVIALAAQHMSRIYLLNIYKYMLNKQPQV